MKRKISIVMLVIVLVSLLAVPGYAAQDAEYVVDDAGFLSETEWVRLEAAAAQVSESYDCGVYIYTVPDLEALGYGSDPYVAAYSHFYDAGLGLGADDNGIIVFISAQYMDYAVFVRGEDAEYAFDEYGQTRMICERTDVHQLKLVWRGEDGPNELYDLATDPDERVNQFENPAYAEKIAALRDRLLGWFDAYVNPDLDGTKEDVRGKGQIDSHTFIH